jgi:regulator of RNase E activity RraB
MTQLPQIVSDFWNVYSAQRDGATMFISFDEVVVHESLPSDLQLCARVIIPIQSPNDAGGPLPPEAEVLWAMEDELVSVLEELNVHCRLVGRLTYDGLREIVFQLHDWDSFRPPLGRWILRHEQYPIDVSEHEGWEFFDDYIRPRVEDEIFMADRSVVDSLVQSGSNPEKEHLLEYAFNGPVDGLLRVADSLEQRGYEAVGELDFASGEIVLAKRLVLDLALIVGESLENYKLAEDAGIEFNGWGAMVVG